MDARRAEQNRTAQRAFRRRKEQHVKDLEDEVRGYDQLQKRLRDLENDNVRLRRRLLELEGQTPQKNTSSASYVSHIPRSQSLQNIHHDLARSNNPKEQEQKSKVLDNLADLLRTHRRPPIKMQQ